MQADHTPRTPQRAASLTARGVQRLAAASCIAMTLGVVEGQPAAEPARRISAEVARPAAPMRILITRSLQRRPIRFVGWTPSGLLAAPSNVPEELAADAAGPAIAAADVLALVEIGAEFPHVGEVRRAVAQSADQRDRRSTVAPDAGRVSVELTDGQRYTGTIAALADPAAAAAEDQPLILRSAVFGELLIPLDNIVNVNVLDSRIAELRPAPRAPEEPRSSGDRVVLANGDVLEGFVASIGTDVVLMPVGGGAAQGGGESGGAGAAVRLPLSRCRRIEIANESKPLSGTLAWISAGGTRSAGGQGGEGLQVVRARELSLGASGEVRLRPDVPGQDVSAAMIAIGRVVGLTPEASSFIPLAEIRPSMFEPLGGRRWTDGPLAGSTHRAALGLADVTLPGAMRVEWEIPAGVVAITGAVLLPPDAQLWGDCVVTIEHIAGGGPGEKVWSGVLSSSHPREEVIATLGTAASAPAVLRISVEPGARGVIQDRVVLEGFMFVRTGSADAR